MYSGNNDENLWEIQKSKCVQKPTTDLIPLSQVNNRHDTPCCFAR